MNKRYNLNEPVDRRGTSCLKYDFETERKNRTDLLPLWVADMDFRLPEEVLSAMRRRLDHGIFGYTDPKPDYEAAVQSWFLRRHGWKIGSGWNTITPGVVYAISTAIRAFTREGDAVLIQQPVYYPFSECIIKNRRTQIDSPLVYENGRYHIDFGDLERKIADHHVKLFLLCSPHNPVGRVWTREELLRVGEICRRYHVLVFADEIHCDFAFPGNRHIPFASLGPEYADLSIVGTSPSKTFNIAGLQVSNIIIPNERLRAVFREENAAAGYSQANVFGLTACQAAYEMGERWFDEIRDYIWENVQFTDRFLREHLPEIRLVQPEGTYLLWLDMSGLHLSAEQLHRLITEKARLWLDDGSIFGPSSSEFERINAATQRSVLEKALHQLETAVHSC